MGLILVILLLLILTGTIHLSGVLAVGAFAVAIPVILVILAVSLVLAVLRHLFSGGNGPTVPPLDGPY